MNASLKQQIEMKASEIGQLSEACGVQRLEIFGSATHDRFDPGHSDLDFLVAFQRDSTSLDNYLRLAEGLEELFGRPVDLVIERSIRNPDPAGAASSAHRRSRAAAPPRARRARV